MENKSSKWLRRHRVEMATFGFAVAMLCLHHIGLPALASCLMAVWALSVADDLDDARDTIRRATEGGA